MTFTSKKTAVQEVPAETAAAPVTVPPPSVLTRLRLTAMAIGIMLAFAVGFVLLSICVRPHYAFLCALIAFFGSVGGLLYAIRESELVAPDITDTGIQVGWIGDCFYGMAGAFAIFLILPNFSETAQNNLGGITSAMLNRWDAAATRSETAAPSTAPAAPAKNESPTPGARDAILFDDPKSGNGADLLEIIAVAIVGGYAGHFVMKRASESLVQKVEKVEQGTKQLEDQVEARHQKMEEGFTEREARLTAAFNDSRAKLEVEVAAARAESEALSLIVQQLNPHWPNPNLEDFKRTVQRVSDDGLARLVDTVGQRLRREKDRIATRAVPILKTLRQLTQEAMAAAGCTVGSGGSCLTKQQIEEELTLLLAQAMSYAGRPDISARFLEKVLRELPPDNDDYAARLQGQLARFRSAPDKSVRKPNKRPDAAAPAIPKPR